MLWLGLFVLLLFLFYIVALLWLGRGLRRAQSSGPLSGALQKNSSPRALPTVTLVVSARNEEGYLPHLLVRLADQDYPAGKLEICLVDDRSTDRTSELMSDFVARHRHGRHFQIRDTIPGFAPKKRAIDHAVRHSCGEIILLTDADARPGPAWVREMVAQFQPGIIMVCGYSPYFPRTNLLQNILALEYFSLAAVSAGSIGAGRPLTCTGSNFAYRRDAFMAVNGFAGIAHFISGDDDLFLHKMHDHRLGKIAYAGHPAVHAAVRPPAAWRDFQSQRTRYASKGRHYKPGVTLGLAAVVLLNLLLCLGFLAILLGKIEVFAATVVGGAIKALFEFFYLRRAAAWLGEQRLLKYFPLAVLLHPFYIVYFSSRAPFAKFSWRGESFATTMAEQESVDA
jgi:cellulose synthase/poly-beta-1,6-N-acetylglucosamine synthase-like glycosyltransferase